MSWWMWCLAAFLLWCVLLLFTIALGKWIKGIQPTPRPGKEVNNRVR